LSVLLYLLNSRLDIMEIDAAQYARMGWEMWESKSFLHLYDQGVPYLDKPHLIFWLSSLSFGAFGMTSFAFKLPAILFSILGLYGAYRFAACWYERKVAYTASLFLAVCFGYFHFTNDVRTDVFLCNSLAVSLWMFSEQWLKPKSFWWIGGFFFAAIAMLAKGPIGLAVPILAFALHALLSRQWNFWLSWRPIAGFILVLVVISPALIGLYTQFDLHPDLEVNGRFNVSGIRFFLWEQSFGRITGESVWKNETGPLFFVHTLSWSFFPWTILLPAVILIPFRYRNTKEWISIASFWIPFLAISFSQYKLPHYVYVVLPALAVLCSVWMHRISQRSASLIFVIQFVLSILLLGAALFLLFVAFPVNAVYSFVALLFCCLLLFWGVRLKRYNTIFAGIALSAGLSMGVNLLLSLHFYPNILAFQSGAHAGRNIQQLRTSDSVTLLCTEVSRSLEFYGNQTVPQISATDFPANCPSDFPCFLYTNELGKTSLENNAIDFEVQATFDHFRVTRLTPAFLIPDLREELTSKRYLLRLIPKN